MVVRHRLAPLRHRKPRLDLLRCPELVRRIGPLPSVADLNAGRIIELLPQDKKTIGGRIHWVIPERVGKVRIMDDVPMKLAATAFREVQASFAS